MASTAPERPARRRRRSRSGAGDGRAPIAREAWTRLAACTAAAALLQLDGTVITVALPSVARDLHVANSATALILTAYFAAYALMLFPGGRLVDRLGARWVALLGLSVFAVGAALGAVVSSLGLLCATRVLQGIGAGLVSPAALAGAISGFPPERRGTALGIWGASAGMANLIGPLLGGVLTVALGWRADWWALVPLALAAAWAVVVHVPSGRARGRRRGSRQDSQRHGDRGRAGRGADLRGDDRNLLPGRAVPAESRSGYSALGASAVLVVVALLVGAAAPLAGGLVDRRGERLPTMLGFLGAGVGMAILAIPGVSLHGIGTAFALIPIGLGLGMLFVPVSRAALNATPDAAHGRTSAVLSEARLLRRCARRRARGRGTVGRPDRLDRALGPGGRCRRLPAVGAAAGQSVRRGSRPSAWHDRRALSAISDPYPLSHVYPIGSRINDRGHLEIGGCDAVDLATEFGTPAFVVAEDDLRARARAYDADSPRATLTATCCSRPRRSPARPSTGCWRRRVLPATSPPAVSWRWRCAGGFDPATHLSARQRQVCRRARVRARGRASDTSCSTRSTTSSGWSGGCRARRRPGRSDPDHARRLGRHARRDLHRPGRLQVRLRHGGGAVRD